MESERKEFLGVGWSFPIQADSAGRIRLSRHEDRIAESIYLILSTAKGERAMRPDFGCDIHQLVFEPQTQATAALVEHHVRDALVRWEPRIEVRRVQVTSDPGDVGTLMIGVEYRVWETDTIFNLVYPFYLERGVR